MSFLEIQKKVFTSYLDGRYEEALVAALEAAERFPEKLHRAGFWSACLYCRIGNPDKAMVQLEEALQKGAWWAEDLLLDGDLQPLWECEDFARLKVVCQSRQAEAAKKSKPELLLHKPANQVSDSIYPTILALHNRYGNIDDFSAFWNDPGINNSYILAFLQSSQVFGSKEFCWDDQNIAETEIRQAYNQLVKQYGITNPFLMSGYSQGGGIAIRMALSSIECAGFIAIVPAFKDDVQALVSLLHQSECRERKGCIITGDRDFGYEKALELAGSLKEHDFSCKLFVEKGMGHLIPDNFTTLLQQAMEFVLQ